MISTFDGLDGENINLKKLSEVRFREDENPANVSKELNVSSSLKRLATKSNFCHIQRLRMRALSRIDDSLNNVPKTYFKFDWRNYYTIAVDNLKRKKGELEKQIQASDIESTIQSAKSQLAKGNIEDPAEIERLKFIVSPEFKLTEEELRMKIEDAKKSLIKKLLHSKRGLQDKIDSLSEVTIVTEQYAKDQIYALYSKLYDSSIARNQSIDNIQRTVEQYIKKDSDWNHFRVEHLNPMKQKVDFYVEKMLEMKAKKVIDECDLNYGIFEERLKEFMAVQEDLAKAIQEPGPELEKEKALVMKVERWIEKDKKPGVDNRIDGSDHDSPVNNSSPIAAVTVSSTDAGKVSRKRKKMLVSDEDSDVASVSSKISTISRAGKKKPNRTFCANPDFGLSFQRAPDFDPKVDKLDDFLKGTLMKATTKAKDFKCYSSHCPLKPNCPFVGESKRKLEIHYSDFTYFFCRTCGKTFTLRSSAKNTHGKFYPGQDIVKW